MGVSCSSCHVFVISQFNFVTLQIYRVITQRRGEAKQRKKKKLVDFWQYRCDVWVCLCVRVSEGKRPRSCTFNSSAYCVTRYPSSIAMVLVLFLSLSSSLSISRFLSTRFDFHQRFNLRFCRLLFGLDIPNSTSAITDID